MTFIDQPENNSKENKKSKTTSDGSTIQKKEQQGKHVENVGLTGGQSEDSKGGVDMSQYTGPESKPSSLFNDPEAEFKTGPGNGLSNEEDQNQDTDSDKPGKSK